MALAHSTTKRNILPSTDQSTMTKELSKMSTIITHKKTKPICNKNSSYQSHLRLYFSKGKKNYRKGKNNLCILKRKSINSYLVLLDALVLTVVEILELSDVEAVVLVEVDVDTLVVTEVDTLELTDVDVETLVLALEYVE